MTKISEIYKCEKCGNIVAMLHPGASDLVCCGQKMVLFEEKTADKTTEKHVPVIEKIAGGYKVYVGTTLHPMEEKHYIEWIELQSEGISYRKFLKPGDKPEAIFHTDAVSVTAREYCNIHGLWKA